MAAVVASKRRPDPRDPAEARGGGAPAPALAAAAAAATSPSGPRQLARAPRGRRELLWRRFPAPEDERRRRGRKGPVRGGGAGAGVREEAGAGAQGDREPPGRGDLRGAAGLRHGP